MFAQWLHFSTIVLYSNVVYGAPRGLEQATVLHSPRQLRDSYDYVIIGGGTAGLTLADRLTENAITTVLVIEYGGFPNSSLITEVSTGLLAFQPQFNYPLYSVPQVNLNNRTNWAMAGKLVGGSSAVNALICVRGTSDDYDRWGHFWNDTTLWSWSSLLPYFKKAMHFTPPTPQLVADFNITYDASYWGNTSHIYAGWPTYQYPGTKDIIESYRQIPGVRFTPDSGSGQAGLYWNPIHMDPKLVQRSYAKTGHYDGIRRPNYHLIAESKVHNIILKNLTAVGVAFRKNGSTLSTAYAKKEVILSAGGLHSPGILQVSGIGPRKLLDAAGIPVLLDLPGVGQNFQDHPRIVNQSISFNNFYVRPYAPDFTLNATFKAEADAQFAANRTGPDSIATGYVGPWIPLTVVSPRAKELSDMVLAQDPAAYLPTDTHPTIVAGYKVQLKALAAAMISDNNQYYSSAISAGAGPVSTVFLHELSRGSVNINISDPFNSEPLVDYRTLSNPVDILILNDYVRFTRRVYFNTTNIKFQPYEKSPGLNVTTDADLEKWIRATITPTQQHPVGTNSMLPLELGGVVDQQLRVHGVKKLRVIDASIIPTLPGANTCQTVYAIAEKAADMLKAEHDGW